MIFAYLDLLVWLAIVGCGVTAAFYVLAMIVTALVYAMEGLGIALKWVWRLPQAYRFAGRPTKLKRERNS